VRTFTIGFDVAELDESAQARAVAAQLGTEHVELKVTAGDAQCAIPELAAHWDEPFADSSAIPTLLLASLTARHVKVALSGDGGDESFGGYPRYLEAERFRRRYGWIPAPIARGLAAAVDAVPRTAWDRLWRMVPLRPTWPADRMEMLAADLRRVDEESVYRRYTSYWEQPPVAWSAARNPSPLRAADDYLTRMQLHDLTGYLPGDILTKVDRASMAHGLEVRVPLLDDDVLALAFSLPRRQKIRDGESKWLLRRVLARHLPPRLIERDKRGFAIPLGAWLRGPLRDWCETLLAPPGLEAHGLDAAKVRARWDEHLAGGRNHQDLLWPILIYRSWCDRWRPCSPT
jgi:asparagine synthase (glutamine-hydrolysing)